MYSPYDFERVGHSLDQMLPQFEAHGIDYQLIKYDAAGHVFPADFDRRFREALRFVLDDPST